MMGTQGPDIPFPVELLRVPVYGSSAMRKQSLIDLYVPSSFGTVDEIADIASNEGLDAVCYVVGTTEDFPEVDEVASANERGRANVIPTLKVEGMGYRWLILVPNWDDAPMEALESTEDPQILRDAVDELGGAMIPICPHQTESQGVVPSIMAFPKDHRVGLVSMVANGSRLGRHLDIEEASLTHRRILGATGPFGHVDDMGRYATLVPSSLASETGIARALNQGLGVAVEMRHAPEQPKKPKKRGRGRRRPRRKRSKPSSEAPS